ncbi:MAG TPA: CheR family methyltransferase [Acetobacteraceae bacterium]
MKAQSFETFAALLRAGSGLVIGLDKQYLLESRLGPIMKQHGLRDLDMLAERLRIAPVGDRLGIEKQIIEAMTTNETFFFRDDRPFQHFGQQALSRLHRTRAPGARLRIWSAAASSGQEAYSLAMILAENRNVLGGREVEILGTDISREQLDRAQEGLYTQFEVQRGLPMQHLVKYFRKDGPQWRVHDTLRAMTIFREWNLLADPRPLGQFDVIFCRNVLIYFDQATKTRVLDALAGQLAPDGLLYLGGSETVLGLTDKFGAVAEERGVYELVRTTPRPVPAIPPLREVRVGSLAGG